ncbi:RNA helicase, partial [Lunasporangiospora selenospora]
MTRPSRGAPYRQNEYSPQRDRDSAFDSYQRRFGGNEFTGSWETTALRKAIEKFKRPDQMPQQLVYLGTSQEVADGLVEKFTEQVLLGKIPELSKDKVIQMAMNSLEPGMTFKSMGVTKEEAAASSLERAFWNAFCIHFENELPQGTKFLMGQLRDISDLRFPAEWNPKARLMKRKIIMHVGPTNSGKTYNALKRLQEAESGAYLSPLRLLAHEVFDKMNHNGTPCNLVTGEERRYGVHDAEGKPCPREAKVVSSTVEMVDLNRIIEVAVVDEIQMLADPDRGWAWVHALLGLPAKEIHLCGEPTVVGLVKKICALTNEEVEVQQYNRLSQLELQEQSIRGDLSKIQKGDCVVTFSRNNIFMLKKAIEAETGLRCAVAYGNLPPESRSAQAKLFNNPDSGYDVLVASDAIGMGLNLNIKRIIFESVEKFDGKVVRSLSLTQLKQIAGRAGRFGTDYAVGKATTLLQNDVPVLQRALAAPMTDLPRAALQPTADMLEKFAVLMPGVPFSHVLRTFDRMSQNSDVFFPALFRTMIGAAEVVDSVKLTIHERISFISAPIQLRNEAVVVAARKIALAVSHSNELPIDQLVHLPRPGPDGEKDLILKSLEVSHRTIMLYLWLSTRFPHVLTGGLESEAAMMKVRCEELIEIALAKERAKMREKAIERQLKRDQKEKSSSSPFNKEDVDRAAREELAKSELTAKGGFEERDEGRDDF